jgi:hypothetical protein
MAKKRMAEAIKTTTIPGKVQVGYFDVVPNIQYGNPLCKGKNGSKMKTDHTFFKSFKFFKNASITPILAQKSAP